MGIALAGVTRTSPAPAVVRWRFDRPMGGSAMTLVLLTAVSVWVLMLVMDAVNIGGFLLESTIAVLGGAAIGFVGAWFLRRRRRRAD
jgi:LPXTG-motif cell wall-anchored protein